MTGTRGPVGKRPEERRRRNKPENEGQAPETPSQGIWNFDVPEPPRDPQTGEFVWHPMVVDFYCSLAQSGTAEWYQISDWAAAQILCESMSRDLMPQFVGFQDRYNAQAGEMEHLPTKMKLPLKGANFSAYQRMFATLGVTEGDRRRMGILLQKTAPQQSPEERAAGHVTDARERFRGRA